MRKYEYKTLAVSTKTSTTEEIRDLLNTFGEDGWELINIMTIESNSATMILKKEKPREFGDNETRRPFSGDRNKRPFDSKPRRDSFKAKSNDQTPKGEYKSQTIRERPKRFGK